MIQYKKHFDIIIVGDSPDVANATDLIMDALAMSDLSGFEVACDIERIEVISDDA